MKVFEEMEVLSLFLCKSGEQPEGSGFDELSCRSTSTSYRVWAEGNSQSYTSGSAGTGCHSRDCPGESPDLNPHLCSGAFYELA